jgi:poly(3-hydroxyalkanoate) synthetase
VHSLDHRAPVRPQRTGSRRARRRREAGELVVDCPISLLAGIKDHITPPEQVWALADLVATPAGHISRELVDGGHLGLLMGRAALAEHWTPIAERVRTYSERGV